MAERALTEVLDVIVRDNRLPRDLENELYRCFKSDIRDLLDHLEKRYGREVRRDDLFREMEDYVKTRIRDIEDDWRRRSHRRDDRGSFERSSMSSPGYFGGGGSGGTRMFSGGRTHEINIHGTERRDPLINVQTARQEPQPVVQKKEEIVPDNWKIGKAISTTSDSVVAIEVLDTTWNGKSIDHKLIEFATCINSPYEAIIAARPYIINQKKPFLFTISACKSFFVSVPLEVIRDLKNFFQSEGLYTPVKPDDVIATERHSKTVLRVLKEFFERINHTSAVSLEKFFIHQVRSLIRTHLVDPTELDSVALPTKLEEIDEFYSGGSVYDELNKYPNFGPLRDMIIRASILNIIHDMYICDWNNPIDRMSMLNNTDFKKLKIGDKYITEIAMTCWEESESTTEMKKQLEQLLSQFVVLKAASNIIFTNIYPNDLRYKMMEDGFDAYTFGKDNPNNIVEAVISEQIKGIERFLVINPGEYGQKVSIFGGIVDTSVRVAPIQIPI